LSNSILQWKMHQKQILQKRCTILRAIIPSYLSIWTNYSNKQCLIFKTSKLLGKIISVTNKEIEMILTNEKLRRSSDLALLLSLHMHVKASYTQRNRDDPHWCSYDIERIGNKKTRKHAPLLAVVIVRSSGSAKTNNINDVNVQKIMSSKLSAFTKIRTPKTIANTNKSGPKLQTYPPKRASR
jgi:hypothetical protein